MRTICEVLSQLRKRIDDETSIALVDEAADMARRMQDRLKRYKGASTLADGEWRTKAEVRAENRKQ